MTKQLSMIEGDTSAVVCVWQSSLKDQHSVFTVRGVEVFRLDVVHTDDRGISYRLCSFPGHRLQWVNEGNIRSRRVHKFAGESTYGIDSQARTA